MEINNSELYETIGGAVNYTSSGFLNAVSRILSTLLSIGQVCGTIIYKAIKK